MTDPLPSPGTDDAARTRAALLPGVAQHHAALTPPDTAAGNTFTICTSPNSSAHPGSPHTQRMCRSTPMHQAAVSCNDDPDAARCNLAVDLSSKPLQYASANTPRAMNKTVGRPLQTEHTARMQSIRPQNFPHTENFLMHCCLQQRGRAAIRCVPPPR